MSGLKEPSFADRQKAALQARKDILNKFRAQPAPMIRPSSSGRPKARPRRPARQGKEARDAEKAERKAEEAA